MTANQDQQYSLDNCIKKMIDKIKRAISLNIFGLIQTVNQV
jgi:hypothetical protein